MLKVYVTTNGCEEGQLSSMYVEQFFRKNKLTITRIPSQADLMIFYACGLTEQKEKDSLMLIRKLQARMKPTARLIVWGCLSKINPQLLATVYNGPLIGPRDTSFFEGILEKTFVPFNVISANTLVSWQTSGLYEHHYAPPFTDAVIRLKHFMVKLWNTWFLRHQELQNAPFFIRVATGCTGHCTYCSERCSWGRINSKPINKIISEFKLGLQNGYNRFVLLATDLGPYGTDIGYTLYDLLRKMVQIYNQKNYKIILDQLNPFYLKEMFSDLEEIFDSGKVEVLCCPVQSGSNRILRLMSRMYTAEEWREHMLRINRRFPNIRLWTHFMVGFPTETDEDFRATLKLLDYPLFLHNAVIFKFSKRPKVYASRIPGQVSDEIKELRYKKLLQRYVYMYALNVAIKKTRSTCAKLFRKLS